MNFPYNAKVIIANGHFGSSNDWRSTSPDWWCQFTLKHDGTELKVEGRGHTLEEAVEQAIERYRVFVPVLPVELLAPVIPAIETIAGDEIPF